MVQHIMQLLHFSIEDDQQTHTINCSSSEEPPYFLVTLVLTPRGLCMAYTLHPTYS